MFETVPYFTFVIKLASSALAGLITFACFAALGNSWVKNILFNKIEPRNILEFKSPLLTINSSINKLEYYNTRYSKYLSSLDLVRQYQVT